MTVVGDAVLIVVGDAVLIVVGDAVLIVVGWAVEDVVVTEVGPEVGSVGPEVGPVVVTEVVTEVGAVVSPGRVVAGTIGNVVCPDGMEVTGTTIWPDEPPV